MDRIQSGQFRMLVLILVVGAVIGVAMGYMIWNPGASNYSVISKSEEVTRTARVGHIQVTYPSVVICKEGEDSAIAMEISNLDNEPELAIVSLSLVRSSGIDSTAISDITSNPYRTTLAAYGSGTNILEFNSSAKGYAIFDLNIRGELAGNVNLYVVSYP